VTLFLAREEVRPLCRSLLRDTGSVRLLEKCGFERAGTGKYGEYEHIMFVLRA
jgi:hypothetical protein